MNIDFFENPDPVKTFGIKYAGSKQKIIPYLLKEAAKYDIKKVFDAFSGTTRVSQSLALSGYNVISNDISIWSETFAKAFLLPRDERIVQEVINHLNAVKLIDGWFTQHYGGDENEEKKLWQNKNTRKLDAIRAEIDNLNLDDVTRAIALTSLILALDKVDSSLGHFTSYLKKWSARSYNDLHLECPHYQGNGLEHQILNQDVLALNHNEVPADLAYFDPPYGSNNEKMPPSRVRYASYYHLWTTIIKNDQPEVFGAAVRREDTRDSISVTPFEEFRKDKSGRFIALSAIEKIIKNANARYVILSYSSGGRATAEDLNDILTSNGKLIDTILIDYRKHIMASMAWTNEWISQTKEPHREFLFVLEK